MKDKNCYYYHRLSIWLAVLSTMLLPLLVVALLLGGVK